MICTAPRQIEAPESTTEDTEVPMAIMGRLARIGSISSGQVYGIMAG